MVEAPSRRSGESEFRTRRVTDAFEVLELEVRVLGLEVGVFDAPRVTGASADTDRQRSRGEAGTRWQRQSRA
jgi:hypothetical protein